eukprot:1158891-Pelagomonas_calceolata.AAC.5
MLQDYLSHELEEPTPAEKLLVPDAQRRGWTKHVKEQAHVAMPPHLHVHLSSSCVMDCTSYCVDAIMDGSLFPFVSMGKLGKS